MSQSSVCISLEVRLQGEDESSARDVSKRLRRRNGRESDIIGLVGTGVGVWVCGGSSNKRDRLSSGGEAKSQGGDWSEIKSLRGRVRVCWSGSSSGSVSLCRRLRAGCVGYVGRGVGGPDGSFMGSLVGSDVCGIKVGSVRELLLEEGTGM